MPAPTRSAPTSLPAGTAAAGARAAPLTVSREALLVDGNDQLFRRLVHAFFAFNARHTAIRDGHARRIGLAGIEYTILISIAHLGQDGRVNVKTVADHLHVTTGFITNRTKKLQELGLVEKTRDTRDRRRTNLTVTRKGLDRLEALAPVQRQVNDAEFGALSRTDFLRLVDLIDGLVDTSEHAVSLQRYLDTAIEAGTKSA